jgi:acylphosphatase
MKELSINVKGKVQGVAFRYFTKIQADKLNIKGTVQNLVDGSVLIYASGTSVQLDELISWCENGGPPAAIVNQIKVEDLNTKSPDRFTNFSIIR